MDFLCHRALPLDPSFLRIDCLGVDQHLADSNQTREMENETTSVLLHLRHDIYLLQRIWKFHDLQRSYYNRRLCNKDIARGQTLRRSHSIVDGF